MASIQRNITTVNRNVSSRGVGDIKYLVCHYVGAVSSAYNNTQYFKSVNRSASAHYFVDETSIWQCVEDKDIAWHCGTTGAYKHSSCRNANSIGVELCCKKTAAGAWYFESATVLNAIWLFGVLAKKYGIGKDQILRHYDVTGKNCPEPHVRDGAAWADFKERVILGMQNVPGWQIEAFKALVAQGFIKTPEYWEAKLGQPITVGEVLALIAEVRS